MSNKLDPTDIEWKFITSFGCTHQHHALFRDDRYSIQMETITPKSQTTQVFGKKKVYFFIDGCEKEMTEIEDLCETWNDLKNFDDPKNEIVWERKIVPIVKLKH
jgi:hypothetical protein